MNHAIIHYTYGKANKKLSDLIKFIPHITNINIHKEDYTYSFVLLLIICFIMIIMIISIEDL